MNEYMIVSLAERMGDYRQIAEEYGVTFEINDFVLSDVLDDEDKVKNLIEEYRKISFLPECTMHGAFFDLVLFSYDRQIRIISKTRMRQSMDIARELGLRGVVFHTNYLPVLKSEEYDTRAIEMTAEFLEELLNEYKDTNIYLENMFDDTPDILIAIAKRLEAYENFGLCLDYGHVHVYGNDRKVWLDEVRPYVKHIHINDNDLLSDLHMAIGQGKICWKEFFEWYFKDFKNCRILIETVMPKDQIASLDYISRKMNFGMEE